MTQQEGGLVGRMFHPAEPSPKPRLTELDLVAIAIFTVAGGLISIAFSIIYIGLNCLNVLGVEWRWIWE